MNNQYRAQVEGSLDGNIIRITTEIHGVVDEFYLKVMDTEEEITREHLIKLGWTPPNE